MIFPVKNAIKNLMGLYLINPSGITIGPSGIGEAAAINKAIIPSFWKSSARFLPSLSSFFCLLFTVAPAKKANPK